MTLKERLNGKETTFGNFLKTWVTGFLVLCSALGAANEFLAVIPPDYVPNWLKTVIVVAGVISYTAGKLTVKKDEKSSN